MKHVGQCMPVFRESLIVLPTRARPLVLKQRWTICWRRSQKGVPVSPTQTKNLVVNRTGKERRRRAIVYYGRFDLCPELKIESPAESRLVLMKCAEI